VFSGPDGNQLDGDALSRRCKRARDRAGLPPLRFHDLRHSFGSQLAGAGYDLPTIQAYYGTPTSKPRASTCTIARAPGTPGYFQASLPAGLSSFRDRL
jgi:integrase